jgi:hypothetical protein
MARGAARGAADEPLPGGDVVTGVAPALAALLLEVEFGPQAARVHTVVTANAAMRVARDLFCMFTLNLMPVTSR